MRVLYLSHDLSDSAIWRRAQMLRRGGAQVRVAGFSRMQGPPAEPAVVLGHTRNGQMLHRVLAVLRVIPGLGSQLAGGPTPDVVLARNLEMLVLAVVLRRVFRQPVPRLLIVYEMLDVHRLLIGSGMVSRALRGLEKWLLARVSGVIISSPGFRREYLLPFARPVASLLLVENKPLAQPAPAQVARVQALPGRVTIGWFGILRCQWSLDVLDALTRADPGRYCVILRGKPARDQLPDFDRIIAANPDMAYHGPYAAPQDLAAIYAGVDVAWLIDRYEAGGNSDWLLPNRLYEGCLHGAIPLALAETEVGRRLEEGRFGLVAAAPDLAALTDVLGKLDPPGLTQGFAAVAALPRSAWEAGHTECAQLVRWLGGLRQVATAPRIVPHATLLE